MTVQDSCDFCKIAADEVPARIVMRDEHVVAFFPSRPATIGHTLVIPTAHVPDIWALDEPTATILTAATLRVARAIKQAFSPDGLNIIQSNGAAATQTVMHLHVHVVPRWAGDAMGAIWPAGPKSAAPSETDALREDEALRAIRNSIE